MTAPQVFQDHALHRATIEAWFRSHPLEVREADDLKAITPHYQQRISEIRQMSKLRIENVKRTRVVNGKVRAADGGYRYVPHEPLGRDATIPVPDRWPVEGAPYQEPWKLT
jgi:hypothetical protein